MFTRYAYLCKLCLHNYASFTLYRAQHRAAIKAALAQALVVGIVNTSSDKVSVTALATVTESE